MCEIMEHYMKECREESLAEGLEKGLAEGRERSIEWMLRSGKTSEQIADFCGYELNEIKKVQKKIQDGLI